MRSVLHSTLFLFACALIVPCLPATALAWNPTPSQPARAVFYPGEVQVEVEETLIPEALQKGGSGFMLVLPPGADRDSFLISVNGVPAGGYFWLDKEEREAALAARRAEPLPSGAFLPENESSPERRALLEAYVALAEEEAQREGALTATSTRLALWQNALAASGGGTEKNNGGEPRHDRKRGPSPEDLSKLDAAFAQLLPGLYLERDKQERALEDTRLRLARAESALRNFDQKEGGEIAVVPYAGEDKTPLRLRYGYALPASCSLSYRLSAKPDEESLTIAQDVAISQMSGFTWNKVDTYVSTLRRDRSLKPALIRPWRIALIPTPAPKAKMEAMEEIPAAAPPQAAVNQLSLRASAGETDAPARPEPQVEDRSTFRLWSLGPQRIEHKTPVRLSLATDSYKARYYYTLRPVSNPRGFLTAELALSSAIELPPGPAQFSVDGIAIGQRLFSFNGDKGFIFFGSDPQVTATVRDLQRSSGEQGLISKDQTLSWHWRITLKNTRTKPVEVLLEDPMPDTPDDSVTLSSESNPRPEQAVNAPEHGGAKVYRWKTTLKPGEPFVIDHRVRAVAPKTDGKRLNPGRRS